MNRIRLFAFLVAFLLVLSLAKSASAYTLLGLEVDVSIQPDAQAHVKEQYTLILDNDTEIETFENYRTLGQNTLTEWSRFLGELKYHIRGGSTPANTKMTAQRLLDIGRRSVTLDLEYDIKVPVALSEKTGSRTTRFTFNPSVLAFDTTSSGETALPNVATLVFYLPPGAMVDQKNIFPQPASISDARVVWVGPITSRWNFSYSVEETLSDEVSAYFSQLYSQATDVIPFLLPVGLFLLVAGFLYNKFGRTR